MAPETRVIEDRLQKLTLKMEELGYNSHMIGLAKERVNELQQRGVLGVYRFLQKLTDRANDKDAYLDILMEGRFAIILARNNFSEVQIEYSEEGPDLEAIWNRNTVYFEVTRRHSEVDEWAQQSQENLPPPDRPENIISKIQQKLRQLKIGEVNVIVFWSDTVAVHSRKMEEAFEYILQEINQNPGTYLDLSGVLFTEGGGVSSSTLKQFHLFKNDKASKPLGTRLANKLESLNEKDPKKWQKEFEELANALKRLRSEGNQSLN
ncbi:hypothetical protein ES708_34806 [subsurface metagenome]